MKRLPAAFLAAGCLVGCGSPETRCREGVEHMKSQLAGVVGGGAHKSADSPLVQAHTHLDIAQTMLATGNYDGCLDNLRQARDLVDQR